MFCRSCGSVTPIRCRPEPLRTGWLLNRGKGQAALPVRRYPYGPGDAVHETRGMAGPHASESDTIERGRPGSFSSCRRSRLEQSVRDAARRGHRAPSSGCVPGALVIEGSLGSNSGKEFDRAPSRTGTLMPQRAAVSASPSGDYFPPCPTQRRGGTAPHLISLARPGSRRIRVRVYRGAAGSRSASPCEIAA